MNDNEKFSKKINKVGYLTVTIVFAIITLLDSRKGITNPGVDALFFTYIGTETFYLYKSEKKKKLLVCTILAAVCVIASLFFFVEDIM